MKPIKLPSIFIAVYTFALASCSAGDQARSKSSGKAEADLPALISANTEISDAFGSSNSQDDETIQMAAKEATSFSLNVGLTSDSISGKGCDCKGLGTERITKTRALGGWSADVFCKLGNGKGRNGISLTALNSTGFSRKNFRAQIFDYGAKCAYENFVPGTDLNVTPYYWEVIHDDPTGNSKCVYDRKFIGFDGDANMMAYCEDLSLDYPILRHDRKLFAKCVGNKWIVQNHNCQK